MIDTSLAAHIVLWMILFTANVIVLVIMRRHK